MKNSTSQLDYARQQSLFMRADEWRVADHGFIEA